MKTRTIFLTIIGAAVAGSLGILAFRTDPVPVDLGHVARGPLEVTVDADGKTRIAEIYEVAAPITGIAQRSPVRVGDFVVAGESIVAVVEPAASNPLDIRSRAQAEAAVREAEAGLQKARSMMLQAEEELTLAQSEYNRVKRLIERDVASLTQLENAEQRLAIRMAAQEAARSTLLMAQGTLERAEAALIEPGSAGVTAVRNGCCLEITAPVDGRVLDIDVISERPVSAGARLLSIGQPDDLEIVADILSTDAVRLEPGDRAIVERWGGGDLLEARVTKIEPAAYTKVSALGIEEQRVDVVFDLITPLDERPALGDGYSVYLRVVEWETEDALLVPLSALFREGRNWAVYVTEGGNARLRTIEIGRSGSESAQVLGGLTEDEAVILHPSERIGDSIPVVERQTQ